MKLFILDLDETLFEATLKHGQTSLLSVSASEDLSQSKEGVIKNPVLKTLKDGTELCGKEVKALRRHQMKGFFNDLYEVRCEAIKNNKPIPFAVKIVTKATYDEKAIKHLFDQFYSEVEENLFSSGKFPIEFFNQDDLRLSAERNHTNISKALFMDEKFYQWKSELPGLTRKNVILIDDSLKNIRELKSFGFTGMHYASNPSDRDQYSSFTNSKENFFQFISSCLTEFRQAVSVLEKNTMAQS